MGRVGLTLAGLALRRQGLLELMAAAAGVPQALLALMGTGQPRQPGSCSAGNLHSLPGGSSKSNLVQFVQNSRLQRPNQWLTGILGRLRA